MLLPDGGARKAGVTTTFIPPKKWNPALFKRWGAATKDGLPSGQQGFCARFNCAEAGCRMRECGWLHASPDASTFSVADF